MYCRYCGKQLSDDSKFCHACGSAVDSPVTAQVTPTPTESPQPVCTCQCSQAPVQEGKKKNNVCCLIGFILSFVSYLFAFNELCIFSLAGLILSIIGLVQAKKRNENWRGFGLAGIIIGGVAVLIGFIFFCIGCAIGCSLALDSLGTL